MGGRLSIEDGPTVTAVLLEYSCNQMAGMCTQLKPCSRAVNPFNCGQVSLLYAEAAKQMGRCINQPAQRASRRELNAAIVYPHA